MLEESTITKAAQKAQISRDTAYKYLKDSDFQKALSERRTEMIDSTIRFLQGKLNLCNETLISIIEDATTAPQVKINAINTIYATCKSMTETAELLAMSPRIAELAKLIEEQGSE